jgi:flavin reductase (DIM6/NTAB) family NADH-FMN oxidoreductase RutF
MEFTGKTSVITPEGVFIIGTYDENGVPNAMNAAWGMQSDMGEIILIGWRSSYRRRRFSSTGICKMMLTAFCR